MTGLTKSQIQSLAETFPGFLDSLVTATGRATTYNTLEEQQLCNERVHEVTMNIDRGIYVLGTLLPNDIDYGRMLAITTLLSHPYTGGYLTMEEEFKALQILLQRLQPQRALKLIGELAKKRINNTRTRRLILWYILDNDRLEFYAVKYRRKLRVALQHAIGLRRTSILRQILAKGVHPAIGVTKEKKIVENFLATDEPRIHEIVSFILGNETDLTLPLLVKYKKAKINFSEGKGLPRTTLEGIRRRYHPQIPRSAIFDLSEEVMTEKEKMITQTAQNNAGVVEKKEFDPNKLPLIDLIIYAYEKGRSEVKDAITRKALEAYNDFPLKYDSVGIIIDASASMRGNKTQNMRPMAIAMSVLEMFRNAKTHNVYLVGGRWHENLLHPEGCTDLASALIEAAKGDHDVLYVVTDGYENAVSGRFDEILRLLRKVGWTTPVMQLTPVLAAEAIGARVISNIPVFPIAQGTMSIAMIKAAFQADPEQGLQLLTQTRRLL